MKPQRFVAGNSSGSDYDFPGDLVNMRASKKEVLVERLHDFDIPIESAMMYRGLAEPGTSVDMFFQFPREYEQHMGIRIN